MLHWRIAFTKDDWYHILASQNNRVVGDNPNGVATVFMSSDDKTRHVYVYCDDDDKYTKDEKGAMQKMIDALTEELGKKPVSIIRY